MTSQLYTGKQMLTQGGVVCIAGDGYQGQTMMAVPFYGRLRRFGFGFAELALSTGATVIPAWTFMEISGKVQVRFEEPLEAHGETHQDQAESLVFQYVAHLKDIWAQHLGDIAWNHVEKFLALPEVKDERDASGPKDSEQKQPEFVLYGLEQDGWIGRRAGLRLNPDAAIRRMTFRVESHAPETCHPITVNFKNSKKHTVHTHVIDVPGASDIQLDVTCLSGESFNGRLNIICGTTFVPHQVNPQSSDTRELGVRLVSVHLR